jgi:hypothetical protein
MIWFLPFLGVTALFGFITLFGMLEGNILDLDDMREMAPFYIAVMLIVYCIFTIVMILI